MRMACALLLLLLAALQIKYWFSDVGHFSAAELAREREAENARNEVLKARNRLLLQEVLALKEGYDAVESRARSELGMVREGETFFLVTDSN